MITLYNYEDKSKDIAKEKALNELNIEEDKVYFIENIKETGLFKNKKYDLTVIKKSDVILEIKNFLEEFSKKFNIELHSEIKENNNNINIMLVSSNNPILIGKDGKTLESLQLVLNQYIQNQTGLNIKIIIDAANYKEKKVKNLEYQIKKICKDVLRNKVAVKLDPMNSYNRRIVHNIVSEFENLTSLSEGEEPNRYIVIANKED